PAAGGSGTRPSSRSNTPENPATATSTPLSRKPATASSIGTPAALVTSTAAPGVDQAVTTGIFQRSDRPMQVAPMPRPSAHIHEAVCAGVAPIACAAWNTIATELAKPTSTVTRPAATADTDWSRQACRRGGILIAALSPVGGPADGCAGMPLCRHRRARGLRPTSTTQCAAGADGGGRVSPAFDPGQVHHPLRDFGHPREGVRASFAQRPAMQPADPARLLVAAFAAGV